MTDVPVDPPPPDQTPPRRPRTEPPPTDHAVAPAIAFTSAELSAALVRPHRAVEVAVGSTRRIARNLAERRALPWAVTLLLTVSVVGALPYGAVLPDTLERGVEERVWRIAALYAGSLALCFPSLHVFSAFVGCARGLLENLVVTLLISSTAAAFCLGFAPIVWFIDVTTDRSTTASVSPTGLSSLLLVIAALMGITQLVRCLVTAVGDEPRGRTFHAVIGLWMLLFLFILYRMGAVLEVW